MRTDAPAKWFRLYAEFATDPKVQMLSEADQRRYLMLLCLRCSNGNVTLHETEVAFQLRISSDEWTATKGVLVAKGLIDSDGKPVKWEKRQFDSDTSAARVSKHRKNKKQQCNVTSRKSNGAETETETEKKVNTFVASKLTTCPQKEILGIYGEVLPELPQPRVWEGAREKNLTARWRWVLADLKAKGKQNDREAGLGFFRRMFAYIHESDFLMGRTGDWSADLGWIVNAENFAKIIQGNYEKKEKVA